jgi:hypothetical protein
MVGLIEIGSARSEFGGEGSCYPGMCEDGLYVASRPHRKDPLMCRADESGDRPGSNGSDLHEAR